MPYTIKKGKRWKVQLPIWLGVLGLALLLAVRLAPELSHAQQVQETDIFAPLIEDLEQAIANPEIGGKLTQLTPLPEADCVERLVKFKPHANNASRLNVADQATSPPLEVVALPTRLRSVIAQTLNCSSDIAGAEKIKTALMEKMSRGQAWRTLECLQYDKDFKAACLLAQEMMKDEPADDNYDLLCLLAARNLYLWRAGEDAGQYATLLEQAANSADAEVARQAKFWKEAVTGPRSAEALMLGQQVWETLHFDNSFREKAGQISLLISEQKDAVLKNINSSGQPMRVKEYNKARLASIVSESGYYLYDGSAISWATRLKEQMLANGHPEDNVDLLSVDYFRARFIHSFNEYEQALVEFEKIFFSGVPSDIAADAGYMMAVCYGQLRNDVGVAAMLNLIPEIYPEQKYVLDKVRAARQSMEHLALLHPKEVQQFIEKNYKEKFKKVFAQAPYSQRAKKVAFAAGKN